VRPAFPASVALTALAVVGFLAAGATVATRSAPPGAPLDVTGPADAGAAMRAPTAGFFTPPAGVLGPAAGPGAVSSPQTAPLPYHEFYFTRAIYSDGRGRGRNWSVDYPEADWFFSHAAKRLANLDVYVEEDWNRWRGNPVWLGDPDLRRYPFLYIVEPGNMSLTEEELAGLRGYLAAGGFLVVDDFWGPAQWANFEREMARVLPGRPIVDLPLDHGLFRIFYNIREIWQVPNVGNGRNVALGYGSTSECSGCDPAVRAIFDDDGRLMVVINFNTDLGDAWEWADNPYYPLTYSTYAFEVAMNLVLYSMTH